MRAIIDSCRGSCHDSARPIASLEIFLRRDVSLVEERSTIMGLGDLLVDAHSSNLVVDVGAS